MALTINLHNIEIFFIKYEEFIVCFEGFEKPSYLLLS